MFRGQKDFPFIHFFVPHSENSHGTYCGAGSDWSWETKIKSWGLCLEKPAVSKGCRWNDAIQKQTPFRSVRRPEGMQRGLCGLEQVGRTTGLQLRSDYVNSHHFKARKGLSHNLYRRLHLPANICPAWGHEIANSSKMNTRFSVSLY